MTVTYTAAQWRLIADHAPDPWLAGTIDRFLVDAGSPAPATPVGIDLDPADVLDVATIVAVFLSPSPRRGIPARLTITPLVEVADEP